jgi:hypothetical protein
VNVKESLMVHKVLDKPRSTMLGELVLFVQRGCKDGRQRRSSFRTLRRVDKTRLHWEGSEVTWAIGLG